MNYFNEIYEITPSTMAILPELENYKVRSALVLEDMNEYHVDGTPSKLIDHACKFFGSSLRGRQVGTAEVSQITHKVPIAIDPHSGMYFFPTASPNNPTCAWISHTHIKQVKKDGLQGVKILFTNGSTINIDVSFGSFMNQMNRTAQYRYLLDERLHRYRPFHLQQ